MGYEIGEEGEVGGGEGVVVFGDDGDVGVGVGGVGGGVGGGGWFPFWGRGVQVYGIKYARKGRRGEGGRRGGGRG